MINLNKAKYIKPLLAQYLLKNSSKIILGNEIRFGSQNLFADLISLNKKRVTAYEIKSRKDDLRNLKRQLRNYRQVFDYLYIVVTENHLKQILSMEINWLGIYCVKNDGEVKIIKKAEIIRSQSKDEILHSITLKFLNNYLQNRNRTKNLRLVLSKKSLVDIKKLYISFLLSKLKLRNIQFHKELGKLINLEDIGLLSFQIDSKVLK